MYPGYNNNNTAGGYPTQQFGSPLNQQQQPQYGYPGQPQPQFGYPPQQQQQQGVGYPQQYGGYQQQQQQQQQQPFGGMQSRGDQQQSTVNCSGCSKPMMPAVIQTQWKCDKCLKMFPPAKSFGCRDCNQDFCIQCGSLPTAAVAPTIPAPVPQQQQQQQQKPVTCDKGHPLVLNHLNVKWGCDGCQTISQGGGDCYSDRNCNIDLCSNCFNKQKQKQDPSGVTSFTGFKANTPLVAPTQTPFQPTTTTTPGPQIQLAPAKPKPVAADPNAPKCPNGHALTKSTLPPTCVWKCDKCLVEKLGQDGDAWSCRQDNYDICDMCHLGKPPAPKPAAAAPVFTPVPLPVAPLAASGPRCPAGHTLVLDTLPAGTEWKCDKCFTKYLGKQSDTWRCELCNFDECENCKNGLPPAASKPVANNNNQMTAQQLLTSFNPAVTTPISISNPTSISPNNGVPCWLCKKPLTKQTLAPTIDWKCDKCFKMFKGGSSYGCRGEQGLCSGCNVDACSNCYDKFEQKMFIKISSMSSLNNNAKIETEAEVQQYIAELPQVPAVIPQAPPVEGRCKSLLIGINYTNSKAELRGCINDVKMLLKFLPAMGFDMTNQRILVDDRYFPGKFANPTKKNIQDAIEWLAQDARPGDNLWLSYSGHGTRVEDDDGDEADGFDEAIVPEDYVKEGLIRDDWVFDHLVAKLPAGCTCRILTDACHSGSLCDLPFTWKWQGEEKNFQPFTRPPTKRRALIAASKKQAACDAWQISGSMDTQTSADVNDTSDFDVDSLVGSGPGRAGGACTSSLVETLARAPRGVDGRPQISIAELLFQLQFSLKRRRFEQVPQFSCTKNFDIVKTNFTIAGQMNKLVGAAVTPASNITASTWNAGGPKPYSAQLQAALAPKPRFRCVFSGLNYPGSKAELNGCHNDVTTWMKMMSDLGFDISDRRVLVDDRRFPGRTGEPTKKEIEDALKWLAEGATPDSHLLWHYSGHGTRIADDNNDEDDGYDEALVPSDYVTKGLIRDDWIFDNLINPLPKGCTLIVINDCCHSASLCDLPWIWKWEGEDKKFTPYATTTKRDLVFTTPPPDPNNPNKSRDFVVESKKFCQANVIAFSGCQDTQTSSDVSSTIDFHHKFGKTAPGMSGGAMTNSMAEVLSMAPKGPDGLPQISYLELLFQLQQNLKRRKFTQVPQLSCSKKIDLKQMFNLKEPIKEL